ncbi:hypothetical protein B0T16DRAFT_403418 [Cercophora newfieldiana]|uniref:C2H2-type domain-containing protein n=1 Tax=Cercophora newfieldiana TaxID=92897 RepID=A0AA39YHR6_9PEZI|nr:hypothetical protein B0T16DRAFT_403418 [Cercophora newfieldiana]
MPYDPGYEDEYPSANSHPSDSVGRHTEHPSDNDPEQATLLHEVPGSDEWGDELGDQHQHLHSDEDMPIQDGEDELEPDQPPNGLSQRSRQGFISQSIQHSQHSMSQAPALATAKRVAVVLHSSPAKGEYIPVAEDEEEDFLITSDITPRGTKRSMDDAPSQSPAAAFPFQPTPVPFPLPDVTNTNPQETITPQPKKRGRPFGWRPGMSYSALNGGAPRPPKQPKPKVPGEAKRRGRPPKPSLTAREIYLTSNPKFPVFPCEWEGCPAQLQNYETLRAHLLIIHGKSGTCRWADCPSKHPSPLQLPDEETFAAHAEKKHLKHTLWLRGEGPKNTSIPTPWATAPPARPPNAIPPWLCNAKGEQVTPPVGLEVESDEDRKRRGKELDRLIMQRDKNAPPEPIVTPEEWEEIQEKLKAKRKRQQMYRDYHAQVTGINGQPPRYGPEWRGLLVRDSVPQD